MHGEVRWGYLFTEPSHQQGTMMSVMLFAFARLSLVASLSCHISRGT